MCKVCATVRGPTHGVGIVRFFLQAAQRKRYLCLPELLRVPPGKHHDLTAVSSNILQGRNTSCPRRAQAVEQAVLDGRAHALIHPNEATRLLQFLRRPAGEIATDAERASHRDVE